MNISLKSKKALVGGSSKGLGNAVAYQLAMSGASVTLVSSNKDRLIKTVDDLRNKTGINHDYLVVDYNNFEDYKKIIKKYLDTNPIDILINNTQGPKGGDVMNVSIEDYQKSFDLFIQKCSIHYHDCFRKYEKKEMGKNY